MQPTATQHQLPLRPANFHSLTDALDYAARGETGMNFFNARGDLYAALPYRDLAAQAKTLARRLRSLGLAQGSPVALVAEMSPDFVRFFFACQLERTLEARISEALAIDCVIALTPLHTLPRTSSGKLSRSEARRNYMDMSGWGNAEPMRRPERSECRQQPGL